MNNLVLMEKIFRVITIILLIGNIGLIIYSVIVTVLKDYSIGIMMMGIIILYICYFYSYINNNDWCDIIRNFKFKPKKSY
jgi:hypothetical protein